MGSKIRPELMPLVVNPDPATLTLEIVTFELPLFVRVTFNEVLVPSVTFPKLNVEGLAPSSSVAATPVPLSGTARGEFEPLLVREMEPVALPVVVGEKTALNVVVAPTAIVTGVERPVIVKPAPDTLACETVRLAVPVFFRLIVCEFEFPSTTLPKLTLAGVAASCP